MPAHRRVRRPSRRGWPPRARALRCATPRLLGLLPRLCAGTIALGVRGADGGQGLVPGSLGLHTGCVKDLLGLLLGRAHAVGGGAVGLGDPLARPRLGLLAQLPRRPFGRLEDARDLRGGVRGRRLALGERLRGGRLRLHVAMVEARPSAGREKAC